MSDGNIITKHDKVWLAPQPGEDDIRAWAEAGAKTVICSRSADELAALPFDLPAEVEKNGMAWIHMPIGGSHGADPELKNQLGGVLDAADGPVVMHCASGTRSAHLYAACLNCRGAVEGDPFDAMQWPGGRDPNLLHALTDGL